MQTTIRRRRGPAVDRSSQAGTAPLHYPAKAAMVDRVLGGNTSELIAIVVTALPVEFSAVQSLLRNVGEYRHETGAVYGKGTLQGEAGTWTVYVVETGAGNTSAAIETERALNVLNPVAALFCGIAGGLKDVALGDVVFANRVIGYETGRAGDEFLPRYNSNPATYRFEQHAKAAARSNHWKQANEGYVVPDNTRVWIGPIAAGEKVVASKRSETYIQLKRNCSDALAIEMEGRGFLEATRIFANDYSDRFKRRTLIVFWHSRGCHTRSMRSRSPLGAAIRNRSSSCRGGALATSA